MEKFIKEVIKEVRERKIRPTTNDKITKKTKELINIKEQS